MKKIISIGLLIVLGCLAQNVIPQAAPKYQKEVDVVTDRKEYKFELSRDDSYIRGDLIKITITNGTKKDIYFDTGFIMPFTTLYFEIYKDGRWQIYNEMCGVAKYPANYTFQKWLETATRLKPKEKITIEKQFSYSIHFNLFKGKYRFKLEYFSMPNDRPKEDYSKTDYCIYREEANFDTVYSNEFIIK